MPNIFSRPSNEIFRRPFPFHFRCPDTRPLLAEVSLILSVVTTINVADREALKVNPWTYSRLRYHFLWVQKNSILMRLGDCSIEELLGLLVNTGLFAMAKKVGKYLASKDCDVSARDILGYPLVDILIKKERPGKSLFIGCCALVALYNRPTELLTSPERTQLEKIKLMVDNSILRRDVREVVGRYQRFLYNSNERINETKHDVDFTFLKEISQIGWFRVVEEHIKLPIE
jgi:hypothetical protein